MSSAATDKDLPADSQPPDNEIRAALAAVESSEVFAGSPRLREFLRYVVEETLAGRGRQIKGKTIAVDVYRRELDAGEGAQNLVRVEARRLRRLLADYYETGGSDDALEIRIASGGYKPSFVKKGQSDSVSNPVDNHTVARQWLISPKLWVAVAGLVIGLVLILAGTLAFSPKDERLNLTGQPETAIRKALRERSVPTLQAANLSEQARGLVFPLFDIRRQQLALEMFRHAIELDSSLAHGFSGAAQVLATMSIISTDDDNASHFLTEARQMADRALELDPLDAWAHGAFGWTQAVAGSLEDSLTHAHLALELDADDGHVLDLVGLIAIVARNPELAANVSHPDRPRSGVGRFGARNIWGTSQYMLGNYLATIDAFSAAPAEGDPVAPPSLMFLAVAHDHLGNTDKAQHYVRELSETWPDFPTAFVVRQFLHKGSPYEQDILSRLAKYGYDSKGG